MSIYNSRYIGRPARYSKFGRLVKARWLITLCGGLIILLGLPILPVFAPSQSLAEAQANLVAPSIMAAALTSEASVIQENSLVAVASHFQPKPETTVLETIPVIVTAYSSTPEETDDTPFITASGTNTRDGIVASNLLPFGAKIRIPEVFGDKIFTVEDRMNQRMGDFRIDVWFPSSEQAHFFGVKYTYIETLR